MKRQEGGAVSSQWRLPTMAACTLLLRFLLLRFLLLRFLLNRAPTNEDQSISVSPATLRTPLSPAHLQPIYPARHWPQENNLIFDVPQALLNPCTVPPQCKVVGRFGCDLMPKICSPAHWPSLLQSALTKPFQRPPSYLLEP